MSLLFIIEFFTIILPKVVDHIGSFVGKFDWHWYRYDSSLTLLTVAQVECYAPYVFRSQPTVLHFIEQYFTLLGDDILALPTQGCEYVEVVVALGDTYFVDDRPGHHGFGQTQQVVLVDCDVHYFELAVVLGQLFDPVHLELCVLLLCIPDAIPVDNNQPGLASVAVVLFYEAALEELHVAILGDELAVLLVQDEVFAGPVLEFRVQTVTHDED